MKCGSLNIFLKYQKKKEIDIKKNMMRDMFVIFFYKIKYEIKKKVSNCK